MRWPPWACSARSKRHEPLYRSYDRLPLIPADKRLWLYDENYKCTYPSLSQPFAYSRAWYDSRMAMIVEVETDNGLIGWGESQDPLRTDWIWQEIYARLRDHGEKVL
jgi:hypothetical protein